MGGATFVSFQDAWLNARGEVIFYARADDGSGVARYGLWRQQPGGEASLVQSYGGAAPGLPVGVTVGDFLPSRLTDVGELAMRATLGGVGVSAANDQSVWVAAPGGMRMLAREGDVVAGGGGAVLKELMSVPTINQGGQVLFGAYLGGAGVDSSNDAAVIGYSPELGVRVIAREGDVLDVDGIGELTLTRLYPDYGYRLNDLGQFAAHAGYTDGSGIARGGLLRFDGLVPEPGGLTVLGAAFLICGRRRARERAGARHALEGDEVVGAGGP
jgi:hypothetical protein